MIQPSGLDIFSKEWFEAYATKVPEPLMGVVQEICTGYQLGNSCDPNLVAEMVLSGIRATITRTKKTKDGKPRVQTGWKITKDSIKPTWETG